MSVGERLNFLLTNRVPRRWATLFVGWLSRIRNRTLTKVGIVIWQAFGGRHRLEEAQERTFESLQQCFTRKLKPGLRPIDDTPGVLVSPCDAIVGEFGHIENATAWQTKGYPYSIGELLANERLIERFRLGSYATLRLRSNFYHRFHAPGAGVVSRVTYLSGDTWNVNPIALRCVERLFCRNERAVIEMRLEDGMGEIALVPVAAILVASMQFSFLGQPFHLHYRGPNVIDCDASFARGDELGYFELGSTIIVFTQDDLRPVASLRRGQMIRMGEPLFAAAR